ncbi:MAG: hypothetical protein ACLP3K_13400 [Candidatus Acidiferrales bacterium]
MNEGIVLLVGIAIVALAYFACAMWKHHTCDIGKLFTLLIVVVGLITGVFLYVHAFAAFLKASYSEDAVWGAVAGVVLFIASILQIIVMFRELFATRVDPIKLSKESNPPTETLPRS